MGRRFTLKEKENNLTDDVQYNQDRLEESRRKQELFLLQRVRTRLLQSQRNIAKLNENLRFLKRCAINCLDLVENTVDTLEQQRQENRKIVQLIQHEESSLNLSKRLAVNPMIAGFTLKRAKISLKRLAPNRHQQRRNSSRLHLPGGSINPSVPVDAVINRASNLEMSSDEELSSNQSEF